MRSESGTIMKRKPDPTIMGFRKSKPIHYYVHQPGEHVVMYNGAAEIFHDKAQAQAWCDSRWKGIKLREVVENAG